MNKPSFVLACVILLLVTGCFMGDSISGLNVSLELPTHEGQNNTDRSVNDTEVQEALRIIDGVLTSNGYALIKTPPSVDDQNSDIIAFYGICGVSLKNNRLNVGFAEFHRRHPSANVRKMCNSIKDKLSNRFGAERVKIEDL
jgi:hypothetical protein